MRSITLLISLVLTIIMLSGCAGKDVTPPKVVSTTPTNGTSDVNPSLTEITVTFNEPMTDKCWSWCQESKDSFPELAGDAKYSSDEMTNTLPVKLKPDTEYVVWINTQKYNSFKDKAGLSAEPYKLTFKTR